MKREKNGEEYNRRITKYTNHHRRKHDKGIKTCFWEILNVCKPVVYFVLLWLLS